MEKLNILNKIIGYGINQHGACGRDGSLGSYDYKFNTLQDAEAFLEKMEKLGYTNFYGIETVKAGDNLKAFKAINTALNELKKLNIDIQLKNGLAEEIIYIDNFKLEFVKYDTDSCIELNEFYIEELE